MINVTKGAVLPIKVKPAHIIYPIPTPSPIHSYRRKRVWIITLIPSLMLQWWVSQKKAISTDGMQFDHKPTKVSLSSCVLVRHKSDIDPSRADPCWFPVHKTLQPLRPPQLATKSTVYIIHILYIPKIMQPESTWLFFVKLESNFPISIDITLLALEQLCDCPALDVSDAILKTLRSKTQEPTKSWWHCKRKVLHAPRQWQTALHCNVVSHWLGAYTKWSLHMDIREDNQLTYLL